MAPPRPPAPTTIARRPEKSNSSISASSGPAQPGLGRLLQLEQTAATRSSLSSKRAVGMGTAIDAERPSTSVPPRRRRRCRDASPRPRNRDRWRASLELVEQRVARAGGAASVGSSRRGRRRRISSCGSCASSTLPLARLYAGNGAPTRAIAMSARCGAGCCATNRTRPPSSTARSTVSLRSTDRRSMTARAPRAGRAGRSPPGAAGWGRAHGGRSGRRCARSRPARGPCRCGAPSSWADPSAPPSWAKAAASLRLGERAQIAAARVITCMPPSAPSSSARCLAMCPLSPHASPSRHASISTRHEFAARA